MCMFITLLTLSPNLVIHELPMEFTVLGKPQVVEHIHGEANTLHDPLLTTLLDFDRRALDQLAHGLHSTVCYTCNNAKGINKKTFFRRKKSVDPAKNQAGRDVSYLLKHIYNRRGFYANVLRQSKADIEEMVKFLKDHIRNQMAHQTYIVYRECTESSATDEPAHNDLNKHQTTKKCLEKCIQLLEWIINTPFYGTIKSEVQKVLKNIHNMTVVFEDFEKVKVEKQKQESTGDENDTDVAVKFLENLLQALRKENTKDCPLTHFVNMVVSPRLEVKDD